MKSPVVLATLSLLLCSGAQAELVRCVQNGETAYQQAPCADSAEQFPLSRGYLNTVPATPPAKSTPQTTLKQPVSQAGARIKHREEADERRCATLRKQLRDIDVKARYKSTAALTKRRTETLTKMQALACSRLD